MISVAHSLKDKPRTGDVLISENVNFEGLLLSESILKGLKASGFERPSPIQLKAIPLGRCGLDLIVQAKSGTGKTCVFSVIALESLQLDSSALQVLVLAPTREIAIQIWDVIRSIGQALNQLKCHTFIGGMPLQEDKQKLKKCHIAVGTPGRIKQLIEQGVMSIENIRLFVLDEADKLLEDSFQEQINWIYSTLPDNKQMLALSATYPEYLAEHLTAYMRNPTFLRLNVSDPALLGIKQYFKPVKFHPLPNKLFESKVEVVTSILSSVDFQQCLVFSNLQTMAQNMADALNSKGWPTACIAGSLGQKDRNLAMSKLKTFQCRVLISTDLTSRGIDADKVNLVINLDVPKDHETYLHRIGRAGRFGTFGACVTIVSEGQEMISLQSVEKKCNTAVSHLPDPIPVDLVKTLGSINLDDMVSTEKIFTTKENDCVQRMLSSHTKTSRELDNYEKNHSSTKNKITIKNEITKNINATDLCNNKSMNGKVDSKNENAKQKGSRTLDKQAECLHERTGIQETINVTENREESLMNGIKMMSLMSSHVTKRQSRSLLDKKCIKIHDSQTITTQERSPCCQSTEKEKLVGKTKTGEETDATKIRCKPKKHATGNFWTQLIVERNDDEEFIQDFHASSTGDDIFDVALELAKETQRVNANKTETLKHKVPIREDQVIQGGSLNLDEKSTAKVKAVSSDDFKIPSLRETIGLKKLENSHTYKTAVESCKMSSNSNNQKKSVDIPHSQNYELDLLQKIKDILSLNPCFNGDTNVFSLEKSERVMPETECIDSSRGRPAIKARRNKDRQSMEKEKMSVVKLGRMSQSEQKDLNDKKSEFVDYSYLETNFLHNNDDTQLKTGQFTKSGQKQKKSDENTGLLDPVDSNYLENSGNNLNGQQEKKTGYTKEKKVDGYRKCRGNQKRQADSYDHVDYSYLENSFNDANNQQTKNKSDNDLRQNAKTRLKAEIQVTSKLGQTHDYVDSISELNESVSETSDSSESSSDSQLFELSDTRRNKSFGYRNNEPVNQGKHKSPSFYNNWKEPTYSSSDEESECPPNPWKYYRKQQSYPAYPTYYPYMYPQNPYYNIPSYPYGGFFYNFPLSLQNPNMYYQMPQQNRLTCKKMYENLALQQKYIKKMLKSYKKIVSKK